jgi:ribonuclease Z
MKRITGMIRSGKYDGVLNIYCNDEVEKSIRNIYPNLFPELSVDMIGKYLNIIVLNDGDMKNIAGRNYNFFDVKARGNKLYGFKTLLDNNEKLVFLGDETCNPEIYDEIRNSGYVMHEAFCLDREQDIFKPYEKHHSTVKSVCETFKYFNIKNLILFHTEDTHLNNRKELYLDEGKRYYSGNILIPDDLEVIDLD